MAIDKLSAADAQRLVQEQGYVLLDVCSMPEYAEAHAEGAYNVPFLHKTPNGMIPNQDFVRVVEFVFPDRSTPIITLCRAGNRSYRAAEELASLGYGNLYDVADGFQEDGPLGVETGEPDDRSYKSLALRLNAEDAEAAAPASEPESEAPPDAAAAASDGHNRFSSRHHRVHCIRHGRDLPGLKRRPYPGALGQRIFDEVSALAWDEWVEHSKMIINEYRINAADPNSVRVLMEQCEQFFYGEEGLARPDGYVPE